MYKAITRVSFFYPTKKQKAANLLIIKWKQSHLRETPFCKFVIHCLETIDLILTFAENLTLLHMRKVLYLLSCMLVASVLLTACSSGDPINEPDETESSIMRLELTYDECYDDTIYYSIPNDTIWVNI